MAFQLSPSVDYREIDLTGVVPAVSTSIGGFAGSFEWGPCEEVVTLPGESNLLALFGKPRVVSGTSNFYNQNDWFASANYLSYSGNLKLVRGVNPSVHRNASEKKTLVGLYKSAATFQAAALSQDTYIVNFSNGQVSGTTSEGQAQVITLAVEGTAMGGASSPGARQGRKVTVFAAPDTGDYSAAVQQVERIVFGGRASSSGNLTLQFGSANFLSFTVPVTNGALTTTVAAAVAAALQARPNVFENVTVNTNTVTFTRVHAGSYLAEGTGVDRVTGRARRTSVGTSAVRGITAAVEVVTPGKNADEIIRQIAQDGPNDTDKAYLVCVKGNGTATIAQRLSGVIKGLKFVYNGADYPVKNIGDSVIFLNANYAVVSPLQNTDILSPEDDISGSGLDVISESAPSPYDTIGEAATAGTPTFLKVISTLDTYEDSIIVKIPGGSTPQKVAAEIVAEIRRVKTPGVFGLNYDENENDWAIRVNPFNSSEILFTAPARNNVEATLEVEDYGDAVFDTTLNKYTSVVGINGSGETGDITFSPTTTTPGYAPNTAVITVNGITVNAQPGDRGTDLAEEWKLAVESAVFATTSATVTLAAGTHGGGSAANVLISRVAVGLSGQATYTIAPTVTTGGGYLPGDFFVVDGATTGLDGSSVDNDATVTLSKSISYTVDDADLGGGMTQGGGTDAIIDVTFTNSAPYYTVSVNNGGTTYTPDGSSGTITILGSVLGGVDVTNDLVLSTVVSGGVITSVAVVGTPTPVTLSISAAAILDGLNLGVSTNAARTKPTITIPDSDTPWILSVETQGYEVFAPMVLSPTSQLSFGLNITLSPEIPEGAEAHYEVSDPTKFVTPGDVTPMLNRQLGRQDLPGFTPIPVSIVNADGVKATGPLSAWEYVEIDNQTVLTITHTAGPDYLVGYPTLDSSTILEPDAVTGSVIYLDNSELIKNELHFQTIKDSLDGGYFYAIYPGAKGNSIGIAFIDSTGSLANYNAATFGDGTKFSDVFDSRPSTSPYSVSIGSGNNDEMHVVVFDTDGLLSGTKGAVLEKYPFVSKNAKGKDSSNRNNYYVDVVNGSSNFVRIVEGFLAAGSVRTDSGLAWGSEPLAGSDQTYASMNTGASFVLSGGKDSALTDGQISSAFDLFKDAEKVDVSLLLTGDNSKTIKKYVMDLADARRDCVCFISPDYASAVASPDVAAIVDYFNSDVDGFNSSSYAVFDSGFKYQYDRYNNSYFWAPLSSDIAGLCARTDATNDSWWSPAGVSRGQIKNVVRLSYNPGRTDRDSLYKNRINPVITQVGQGTMLYGDKTALSKPSAFDRINVRRLFITLEKAISTYAKAALFEFNDSFTRASFVQKVDPYLRQIKGARGIEDYRVICDTSNNTANVINSNGFVGDIYVKPARSINFISLNFVAVNSGVSFEEVINPTGN